jgi:hypothetical protein
MFWLEFEGGSLDEVTYSLMFQCEHKTALAVVHLEFLEEYF